MRSAFWVAVPVNAPVSVSVPSVPTRAVVVTFDRVTATAGAMSTLPPLAPIFASVIAASAAVALSVTFAAPVSVAPLSSSAVVVSVTRFRATDAPTPTLVEVTPPAVGSAFTVLAALLAAVIVASPPVRTTAPPTSAVVVWFTTARPSEPATEILPPPAPLGRLRAVGRRGVGAVRPSRSPRPSATSRAPCHRPGAAPGSSRSRG